jgi:hypothetical protein
VVVVDPMVPVRRRTLDLERRLVKLRLIGPFAPAVGVGRALVAHVDRFQQKARERLGRRQLLVGVATQRTSNRLSGPVKNSDARGFLIRIARDSEVRHRAAVIKPSSRTGISPTLR